MKRPLVALFAATAFVTVAVAGCAEQPGKKKEESDAKVETKTIEGKTVAPEAKSDAKPEAKPEVK